MLYKRSKSGSILEWDIEVDGNKFRTISGQQGGAKVISSWTVCEGKNIGRANETTPDDQALREAEANRVAKIDEGYRSDIADIDTVGTINPMLAFEYGKVTAKKGLTFPVYSQPKLDGMRCIVTKSGMFSRNGKPVVSAPHILEQLKATFNRYPNLVFDGELYNHDFKADFNRLISLAKKTKPTENDLLESRLHLDYHIYDLCASEYTFSHRYQFLQTRVFSNYIPGLALVKTLHHRTQEELDEAYALYLSEGYEGQMVRRDAPYEFHRSNNLLKRKEMITEEFVILEIIEGIGNRSGIAGAVRFEKDGKSFNSGISGTHGYCLELLNNRDSLVGKQATVRYQNLTPDGIPRFPVLLTVRDYE